MNRNVAHALFAFVCLLLLAAGAVFGNVRQARRVCKGVQIRIANESDNFFISDAEVRALLTNQGTDPVKGRRAADLNLGLLERRLRANPYVKDAEVARDLTGSVRVRIRQNRPVARLIHPDAALDQYIAEDGHLLPLSGRYTARVVPVSFATGPNQLGENFFRDSTGMTYLSLIRRIEADPFWQAQVAQLTIQPDGKVILWPQVGDHLIEFGYPDRVSEKLNKLLAFYRHAMPAMGWDRYRRINVEYRNQIVCQ